MDEVVGTRNDDKITWRVVGVIARADYCPNASEIHDLIVDEHGKDYSMKRIYKGIAAAKKQGLIECYGHHNGMRVYRDL